MTEILVTNGSEAGDMDGSIKIVRASPSLKQVEELAWRLYGLTVISTHEFNGYHDRNYYINVSKDCTNIHIDEVWPHGYVLKVINTADTRNPANVDAQSLLLRHLDEKIPGCCPLPVKNVSGRHSSLETLHQDDGQGRPNVGYRHLVRLLCFIPGQIFSQIPQPDYDLYHEVGKFMGRVDQAIKDFQSSALDGRNNCWTMYNVPKVMMYTDAVRDCEKRKLAEDVIEAYKEQVAPNFDKFQKGTIHGDFNEQNVLVCPKDDLLEHETPTTKTKYKHVGIIDFGENANACYIFEIGLSMMYLSTCCRELDSIETAGHLLAGYLEHMTLNDLELDVLRTVVAGRYAQSLVLGEYFYSLTKNEYCLSTAVAGWEQLKKLWETPKNRVMETWFKIIHDRNCREGAHQMPCSLLTERKKGRITMNFFLQDEN